MLAFDPVHQDGKSSGRKAIVFGVQPIQQDRSRTDASDGELGHGRNIVA